MNIFKGLAIWIASRRLFKNWLSAGLKYLLVKHRLAKGDVIVECDMRTSKGEGHNPCVKGTTTMKRFAIPASMFVVALTIRLVIALQGIHGTDILAHIEGAKSLLLTGSPYCAAQYVYPPLYSALQLSSILAFGWNLLGYKFMPVLFDSATSLMMYVAVRKFTRSERLALASQALWALNPSL